MDALWRELAELQLDHRPRARFLVELPTVAVPPQKADHPWPVAVLLQEHARWLGDLPLDDRWLPLPPKTLRLENGVGPVPQQEEVPEKVLMGVPQAQNERLLPLAGARVV